MLIEWAPRLLLLLGVGFLIANLRLTAQTLRYFQRRSKAVLTWRGSKPQYYGMQLALGVVLGLLLVYDADRLIRRHEPVAPQLFGVAMMFLYYGYALPLSMRIGRGFYEDGIWAESGFIPYADIGAVTWREGRDAVLVVVLRLKSLARRLPVPSVHYGAARRLLRDKIAAHDIQLMHTGLELGAHDERDDV